MSRPLRTIALAASLLGLAWAGTARAEQIFVTVTGQQSGVFTDWYNPVPQIGEVSLVNHGLVEHLAWSVLSPRDAASGLPTGKRQHRPLTIGVRMSAATAEVGNSLAVNENLTTVSILWFDTDPVTGEQALRRTMTLTNASISALSVYTVRDGDEAQTYMDVSFTYQAVGIEDLDSQLSYSDDWESPISAPQLP